MANIFGTIGNDPLKGTTLADIIFGYAGNDTIDARGGDDCVFGDEGNDIISGGSGKDTLYGGTDNDSIDGGSEDDIIIGGNGKDTLQGGTGNDTIYGDDGYDSVSTVNLIQNGSFEDINLGTAIPTPWGYVDFTISGWDRISGPWYEIVDNGHRGIATADGNYWLDMDASPGNLTIEQAVAGLTNGEEYVLVFNLANTNADDSVEAYWGGQLLGTFSPTPNAMQEYSFTVVGGDGDASDALRFVSTSTANNIGVSLDDVQLYAIGDSSGGSDDLIDGGSGHDVINANAGNDTVSGGSGDDVITAGSGNDTVSGGSGNDAIDGGSGNDTISGGSHNDTIYGGVGNDSINGNSDSDEVGGGDGNDTISGDSGNDTVIGDSGHDLLYGNSGFDKMFGGTGSDTLIGGTGNDTTEGGASEDFFVFGPTDGLDVVNDFLIGGDIVRLQGFAGGSFAATVLPNLTQVGLDAVITFDASNKITLLNVDSTLLSASDFQFV